MVTPMAQEEKEPERVLKLNYSGRIIDHLGLQMYQSPVAAIAELVANAWDADADKVEITLPDLLTESAEIVIKDNGHGMDFNQCRDRFLNVGYARRGNKNVERSPRKGRRILGRKGIGKFAGFGIAQVIRVETISGVNGEATIFEMDMAKLRSDEYVNLGGSKVDLIDYKEPDPDRRKDHGTTIRLKHLNLSHRRDPVAFAQSMARRFLLHQTAADFRILVNGSLLPDGDQIFPVQFTFPAEYRMPERPEGLRTAGDWGIETVGGKEISWRVRFYQDPIGEEELRGISIFAGGKMVQAPFFFNLSGGLPGQHGQQYISGQIQADFIDEQDKDLVAPERQRVNWEHPLAAELQEWGRQRLRQLLNIWRDRRSEERVKQLEERISGFVSRLSKLRDHERRTLSRALRRVAQIETLTQTQFEDLGDSMLTAWEQGRLRDLIADIAEAEHLTPDKLVNLLAEAQVLIALNTAEAVKTKLHAVGGLKQRIAMHELENAVRDYISQHPWLVSPDWETFAVETAVFDLLSKARTESGIAAEGDFRGRVDLALSSGTHLLILEFMRPGLALDWDHVTRFERYVRIVRGDLAANTGGKFVRATGYVVADKLQGRPEFRDKLNALLKDDMYAMDWPMLFSKALAQWKDFLKILVARDPQDERLKALIDERSG